MREDLLSASAGPSCTLGGCDDGHVGHSLIPVRPCDSAVYLVVIVRGYVSLGVARTPCYLLKADSLTGQGHRHHVAAS